MSLDSDLPHIHDPFLRKSLMLAVDGTEPEELRKMMQLELDNQAEYEDHIPRVFESAGGFAPTIGIIGAVLGLIQVMQHLEKLDEVGRGIAVAFVATVYGVGSANLFFLPGSGKLRIRIRQEQVVREMTLEGVISILEGMNPRMLETKLLGFLQDSPEDGKETGPPMSNCRSYNTRVSHERWLVSYADFITLMFASFVVMFASARIDKEDDPAHGSHPVGLSGIGSRRPRRATLGGQPCGYAGKDFAATSRPSDVNHKPEDFAAIQKQLEKLLSPEIKRREVALRMEPDGLIISLREIGFFDSGSAQIKAPSHGRGTSGGRFLQARSCSLRIEGHTDNVPIHTPSFASNWELSTARATGLVRLLIENEGFAPERLSAAGYGEFHPVADNSSAAGQQLNRRVDIVVVPQVIAAAQLPLTPAAPHSPPD